MTSPITEPSRLTRPIPYEEAKTVLIEDPVVPLRAPAPSSESVFTDWLEQQQAPAPSLFQRIFAMLLAVFGR